MKKYLLFAAGMALVASSCSEEAEEPEPQKTVIHDNNNGDVSQEEEILKAYSLINSVRKNPSAYSSTMGVDLSGVAPRDSLNWNEILAKVAQTKANDMATNDYFSHTDLNGYVINYYVNKAGYEIPAKWYADKTTNYFENIAAGYSTGEATVKQLIYDKGANNASAGHRASLLGMTDWTSNCYDIGIGFAYNKNSKYRYYWSIIIAKHNY